MLDWSLLGGPLAWVITTAGAAGLVLLLAVRTRRWWLHGVPLALVAAAALTGATLLAVQVTAIPAEQLVVYGGAPARGRSSRWSCRRCCRSPSPGCS